MSNHEEKSPKPRSRFRRLRFILLALGCFIALLAVAWVFLEQYLQIERYRPALERKIAEATGLPVSIGRLELTLRPLPMIRADAFTLGKDDFRLEAAQAFIEPDLQALAHRDIRITAINLLELNVVVPSDPAELQSHLRDIGKRMGAGKSGQIRFDVDRIQAKQATLYVGAAQQPVFTGDLDLHDVLSPTPSGRLDAAVLALREELTIGGDVHLRRGPQGKGIEAFQGTFSMGGLRVATVIENEVVMQVDGGFSETEPRTLTVNLSGNIEPAANAPLLGQSLEGPFTAKANWDGTTLRLEGLRWTAAGLELAGDVARTEDGAYRVSVPSATLGPFALNQAFGLLPASGFYLDAAKEASVGLVDVAVSVPRDGRVRLERGRITLAGINLLDAKRKNIAPNVKGVLVLEDGAVRVEGLEGVGLALSGAITPDYAVKLAKVDLTGTFALSRESLQQVMPVEHIRDLSGSVTLKRITGTFGAGTGLPKDFVLEGNTENARLALNTPTFEDVYSAVSASFTTEGKTVNLDARGQSERMGALEAAGRFTLETRAFEGTFTGNAPKVTAAFLKNEVVKERLTKLLEAYGPSTFDISATLPTATDKRIALLLTRHGDPALRTEFDFPAKPTGGYGLGAFSCNGVLPVSVVADQLPPDVVAAGNATVAFARVMPDATFRADIDLTSATASLGHYLRKPEGVPATIVVMGKAAPGAWAAETLTAAVAGATATGVWREKRLVFVDLELDASKLSALLANNTQATGAIRGTVLTGPLQADLVLQNVAFHYKPEVSIESIDGRVAFAGGRLGLDGLVVRGANSTATLALVRGDGVWSGSVTAQQLDVNRILELQKAARTEPKTPPTEDANAKRGFHGQVTLQADRFLYRRAELTNVTADITGEGNRIVVSNASLHPVEGLATGEATATRDGATGVWVVDGKTNLKDASASLLDELLFKEPRGFTGKVDGDVTFSMPIITGAPPINVTSATANLVARKGSFGKMGVATKVLNVLRSTELLRLRLPSMSDQGLTYDTAKAELDMTDGVMQVKKVTVERPSFALSAEGVVDFPKDNMRLDIRVHPFESVTGLAEKVPLLGGILGGLKDLTPIGLVAHGSPYDPAVTPGNMLRTEIAPGKPAAP